MIPALALAWLPGCVFAIGDFGAYEQGHGFSKDRSGHYTVDGVRLQHERDLTLDLAEWDPKGLSLHVSLGDAKAGPGSGPSNQILAHVHEYSPGDAFLEYRAGELLLSTRSGQPAALASLELYIGTPLSALVIDAGAGDIEVDARHVVGSIELTTGSGDLTLTKFAGGQRAALETGLGSVRVNELDCEELSAESGMGSIQVMLAKARKANLESGLGDITLSDCKLIKLAAETGLGDIVLCRSEVVERELETGLGTVRIED